MPYEWKRLRWIAVCVPVFAQQPRNDLLFEHAPHLARHARREEEARLADVHREAARGADGIVEHLGAGRQHRLLPVVRRHHAAAAREEVLHRRQPRLVQLELDAGGLRGDFLRQVVDRGPEAAIDDDRVGALAGQLEGEQQVCRGRRRPWSPTSPREPKSSSFWLM